AQGLVQPQCRFGHQPYCAIPARGNQGLDLLATGLLETFDQGLGGLLGAGGQPQARRPVGAARLPLQNPAPTSTGALPRGIDDGGASRVQYPHLPMAASIQPNSLPA